MLLFLLWILLLPNAPYLTTDLFHLNQFSGVPLWFDLVLILFFVITGLLFWIKSLDNPGKIACVIKAILEKVTPDQRFDQGFVLQLECHNFNLYNSFFAHTFPVSLYRKYT